MKTYAPGTLVGERYKIVAPLGRGGMGHVYRALHLGLNKEVALKVLGVNNVENLSARFEREAQAIARLDHPNSVRVIDYGRTADHVQFLAMDLLEGPTLAAALRDEGRFSPARAVHVARSLLAALSNAHASGVLHRDVKPENVVLVTRGVPRVVLIDFGLASIRDALPLTATGMCIGSPSYIAPERLLGHPHDERSDLYSIGIILYELLAGHPPFFGSSPEQIMQQTLSRPPRPLRAIRADISLPLDAIVRRALARDPARRYADAEDMLSALDELPMLEEQTRASTASVDDDAAQTAHIEIAQLDVIRPSVWSRMWTWLRFGRWRWERRRLRDSHG